MDKNINYEKIHKDDMTEFLENVRISGWDGNGAPPAWTWLHMHNGFGLKDINTGEIGTRNHIASASEYPPADDYVIIQDDLPPGTKKLFILCKNNMIMRGAIQFKIYFEDDEYKNFIDTRAESYIDLLNALPFYWYSDHTPSVDYCDIFDGIRMETLQFFTAKNQKGKKELNKIINDSLGIARDEPDKIPQKIEEESLEEDMEKG